MTPDITRRSLHGLAELVLAGPQYRTSHTIRLQVTPQGFATVATPALRVDGLDLVGQANRVPISGRTSAELAAAVGVRVGAPENLYHDGSGVEPDELLTLDPDTLAWIHHCWAQGAVALSRLDPTQQPVLWPEHFDVGILSHGISYGISPGDGYLAEPYAYVNPGPARTGRYWNASFGAARSMRTLDNGDADAVLNYFRQGRAEATMVAGGTG